VQLYNSLYETAKDIEKGFPKRISAIFRTLQELEADVIGRTSETISREDQQNGILIQRSLQDANIINEASGQFFAHLNNICREAGLASKVTIIPSMAINAKKRNAMSEKILPDEIASIAITKQIDDTSKRARSVLQRINILLHSNNDKYGRGKSYKKERAQRVAWADRITVYVQRFGKQQILFIESMTNTVNICIEVNNERLNHIKAIEIKTHT
jgi:hypothetical protein